MKPTAMKPTPRFITPARAILLTAGVALSSSAFAGQVFQWSSSSSGAWFAPANWSPSGIPSTDSDTAVIGGTSPIVVEALGANSTMGLLNLTNPAAELRIRSGSAMTFTIAAGATINGLLTLGDSTPGTFTLARLSTVIPGSYEGSGRVALRAPAGDPTRVQLLAVAPRYATWGKNVIIEGTGCLLGIHKIPGVVRANDLSASPLEFRAATIDGLNTGTYFADGAVLRLFQSAVSNARLESINGGRIELSAPSPEGTASKTLLNKSVVRGTLRSVFNATTIQDTDFEGSLEIPAGTGIAFIGPARSMNMTAQVGGVNGGPGSGPASLWLGTGTPTGGGEIHLNAVLDPAEASLGGDGVELGNAWTVQGHGSIGGSVFIRNTIAVEGPSLCPLRFSGTIDGNGTLEARGGMLEFAESTVSNIHVLATQNGSTRVSKNSTWTAVNAQTPIQVTAGEFKLVNTTIAGNMDVKGAHLRIGGSTVIDGDIVMGPGTSSSVAYLRADPGAVLGGSGRLEFRSFNSTFWSGMDAGSFTISEGRSIHGSGVLAGTVKILGPIYSDDTTGVGLRLVGDLSGSGTNTIDISTGELMITTSNCSQFHVFGQPGSMPLRVGNGVFSANDSTRVGLTDMDIDADSVLSQKYVELTRSIFHRKVNVTGKTYCRVFAACRFDGDVVLESSAGDLAVLEFRADIPTINRIVFANKNTDEPVGYVTAGWSLGGPLSARIVGTGIIATPMTFSGTLAPSDESNGGPVGRLWMGNGLMQLTPDATYEADVVSTEKHDRIDADGGAAVNGTLRIAAAPGFYPPPKFNFHLIRGKVTGAFATVIGPPGFKTTMTYNNAGALARFEKLCGSDLNADNIVDDADFAIFCAAYDTMLCSAPSMPENCPADLDRDRTIDDTDFRIFLLAYADLVCPTE